MIRSLLLMLTLAACATTPPPPIDPLAGEPLLFDDPAGKARQVDRVMFLSDIGARIAPLPIGARAPVSEGRIDLGFIPIVGDLFGRRITAGDAMRDGRPVGEVFISGPALLVDMRGKDAELLQLPVTVATTDNQLEPFRYELGPLELRETQNTEPVGAPVGTAYLLAGRLVIASSRDLAGLADFFDIHPYPD